MLSSDLPPSSHHISRKRRIASKAANSSKVRSGGEPVQSSMSPVYRVEQRPQLGRQWTFACKLASRLAQPVLLGARRTLSHQRLARTLAID